MAITLRQTTQLSRRTFLKAAGLAAFGAAVGAKAAEKAAQVYVAAKEDIHLTKARAADVVLDIRDALVTLELEIARKDGKTIYRAIWVDPDTKDVCVRETDAPYLNWMFEPNAWSQTFARALNRGVPAYRWGPASFHTLDDLHDYVDQSIKHVEERNSRSI